MAVDNHNRQACGYGHGLGVQAAAVNQHGVPRFAARAGELVHDAAVAANKAVFGVLPDLGDFGRAQRQPENVLHGFADGNFQRGRRA